jgi:hypothetical protein
MLGADHEPELLLTGVRTVEIHVPDQYALGGIFDCKPGQLTWRVCHLPQPELVQGGSGRGSPSGVPAKESVLTPSSHNRCVFAL